jgi:hypothetical protein
MPSSCVETERKEEVVVVLVVVEVVVAAAGTADCGCVSGVGSAWSCGEEELVP